ncbi:GAF domain-containing protein [Pseudactinotalea sp. HY160]|uniref:GAF domain-containing sensor histidine kinase n=1 Tax=Pseudactinotalea sp. HY160 TaxID=2654490 RepID=UPI00128E4407|nr:GAF domain-containing protein [Pseudactinotalea sp. HY160]
MKRIIDALLTVTSHLDLNEVLGEIVTAACHLTGARYAAIGVLDSIGQIDPFVSHGLDPDLVATLRHPEGRGVLAAIPPDGHLVLEDLTTHPDFGGFPEHHPIMHTFLGVPIHVAGEAYGRLYVAEKDGGFTEADTDSMHLLASAAAVAVQNSDLYTAVRTRERWLQAGHDITSALLQDPDPEDALALIASRIRQVADADAACIVLPGVGGDWVIEIVDGPETADLLGIVMPAEGRARSVLSSGAGLVVDSFSRTPSLRVPEFGRYGPALYAPLLADGNALGVIALLRRLGAPEFMQDELTIAESIAGQAALALKLAEARAAQDRATLLDERARIGRDLHDLAIQQLFATGLQLSKARESVTDSTVHQALTEALDGVDDSVRQIRAIVRSIRSDDEAAPILERLQRETSLARTGLGFAPSLVVTPSDPRDDVNELAALVGGDLADDIVAVVREGLANAARHARASSVHVQVDLSPRSVQIEVADDGVGIDPARTRASGLANLGSRARRHGGTFMFGPGETGGSLLHWDARLG